MLKFANAIVFVGLIVTARLLNFLSSDAFNHANQYPILSRTSTNTSNSSRWIENASNHQRPLSPISNQQSLSIGLGELPGYTGWARPGYTDAPFYTIEHFSSEPHFTHHEVTFTVRCDSPRCSTSTWAQFYVRMYGPAILTGQVTSIHNGRYEIKFLPRIAGKYWIEVVLTFSKGTDPGNFPISPNKTALRVKDPPYEGYLLTGFPFAIHVTDDPFVTASREDRICGADDLRVQSIDDGLRVANWIVLDKVNAVHHERSKNMGVSLRGYQDGNNSLGIWADYQPTNCNLIGHPFRSIVNSCVTERLGGKPIHFVFIGDSVIRLQMGLMLRSAKSPRVKATIIGTHGGIIQTIDNVTATLSMLNTEDEEVVVLFNAGLHDIGVFCSDKLEFRRPSYMSNPADYSCVEQYQDKLTELVAFLSVMPARVKVFQTTTAGWMKWGNYGPAWNPGMAQAFATSSHLVDAFNHVALRVLDGYDGFDIVDAYWLTLARPDNREIDKYNAVGKHLVHPGTEVLRAMVRTWMTLVLSRLGC